MADPNDVIAVMQKFDECRPDQLFKKVDISSVGIDCMLRLLFDAGRDLSSGEITELMNVSSARVAVLVRKTLHRGLIEKECDPADARKTRIRITDSGIEYVRRLRRDAESLVAAVIDRVGMTRLSEFFEIADEIDRLIEDVKRESDLADAVRAAHIDNINIVENTGEYNIAEPENENDKKSLPVV